MREEHMTYFNDTAVSAGAQPSRIAALMTAVSLKMRQRKVYRQTFNELSTLSNRELHDIALSRGDIRRVAREAAQQVG